MCPPTSRAGWGWGTLLVWLGGHKEETVQICHVTAETGTRSLWRNSEETRFLVQWQKELTTRGVHSGTGPSGSGELCITWGDIFKEPPILSVYE